MCDQQNGYWTWLTIFIVTSVGDALCVPSICQDYAGGECDTGKKTGLNKTGCMWKGPVEQVVVWNLPSELLTLGLIATASPGGTAGSCSSAAGVPCWQRGGICNIWEYKPSVLVAVNTLAVFFSLFLVLSFGMQTDAWREQITTAAAVGKTWFLGEVPGTQQQCHTPTALPLRCICMHT